VTEIQVKGQGSGRKINCRPSAFLSHDLIPHPVGIDPAEMERAGCPALSSRYLRGCYFFTRLLPKPRSL